MRQRAETNYERNNRPDGRENDSGDESRSVRNPLEHDRSECVDCNGLHKQRFSVICIKENKDVRSTYQRTTQIETT